MWPRHTEPSLGFFRIGIKLTLPHTFHEWKNARTLSCHSIDSCSWSLPSCHHRRVAMGSDRVASVCKCSHTFLRCIRDGVWLGAQCVAFDVMYACVQCDRCRCFSLSFLMRVLPFISLRIVGFLFNGHHRTYVERLESGVCVTLWHVCCPQPQHTHTRWKNCQWFSFSLYVAGVGVFAFGRESFHIYVVLRLLSNDVWSTHSANVSAVNWRMIWCEWKLLRPCCVLSGDAMKSVDRIPIPADTFLCSDIGRRRQCKLERLVIHSSVFPNAICHKVSHTAAHSNAAQCNASRLCDRSHRV